MSTDELYSIHCVHIPSIFTSCQFWPIFEFVFIFTVLKLEGMHEFINQWLLSFQKKKVSYFFSIVEGSAWENY